MFDSVVGGHSVCKHERIVPCERASGEPGRPRHATAGLHSADAIHHTLPSDHWITGSLGSPRPVSPTNIYRNKRAPVCPCARSPPRFPGFRIRNSDSENLPSPPFPVPLPPTNHTHHTNNIPLPLLFVPDNPIQFRVSLSQRHLSLWEHGVQTSLGHLSRYNARLGDVDLGSMRLEQADPSSTDQPMGNYR